MEIADGVAPVLGLLFIVGCFALAVAIRKSVAFINFDQGFDLGHGQYDTGTYSIRFVLLLPGSLIRTNSMNINFKGKGTHKLRAEVKDASGNIVTSHGQLTVSSSNDSVATAIMDTDGVTIIVTGTGVVGTADISVVDAADGGIHAAATVTTEAGEADHIELDDVVEAAPAAAPGTVTSDVGNGEEPPPDQA